MARYLLNEPPQPPEFGMAEMRRDLEGHRPAGTAAEAAR